MVLILSSAPPYTFPYFDKYPKRVFSTMRDIVFLPSTLGWKNKNNTLVQLRLTLKQAILFWVISNLHPHEDYIFTVSMTPPHYSYRTCISHILCMYVHSRIVEYILITFQDSKRKEKKNSIVRVLNFLGN